MVGTPTLVPEPRTVIVGRQFRPARLCSPGFAPGLHVAEAKLGQRVFEQARFIEAQVTARLLEQHGQHVDRVLGRAQVGLGVVFLVAEVQQAQEHLRFGHGAQHQELESGRRNRNLGAASGSAAGGCGFSVSLINFLF